MSQRFAALVMVLIAASMLSLLTRAQTAQLPRQPGAVYDFDFPNERPSPPPVRDISGIWEAAEGPNGGVNGNGSKLMPSDGKHVPPYTPEGWEALRTHKPTFGALPEAPMVPSALTNDPVPGCDPQGFPRLVLHNFRTSRILQTPDNVVILYLFNKKWRVIWTDGRPLPKNVEEPRWWGYSVGKWVDDYTFEAETVGLDERTWLDNVGRPHSDALRVVEQYKRVDRNHLVMTVTIDDPKYYTKPWVPLILRLRLQSPGFDMREMECSPSETARYNRLFANPAAGVDEK